MFGLGWPESGLGDARIFPVYSTGGYAWRAEIYVNFLCILRVAMLGEAKYTAISCILRVAMLGEPASPGLLTVVVPCAHIHTCMCVCVYMCTAFCVLRSAFYSAGELPPARAGELPPALRPPCGQQFPVF